MGISNDTDICSNGTGIVNCSININGTLDPTEHLPVAYRMNPAIIQAYNVYLYIMIALGTPGNLLVLVVFMKYKPSTSTDWFILFITTFDFIASVVNVPIYATFTNGLWSTYGTNLICRVHMFLSQSFVLSSSFLICGLALDRYFKVCKPNRNTMSKIRARNYCLIISILTFLLSIPCFIMYENINGRCIPLTSMTFLYLYYLMVFLSFLVATATVIVAYIHVTRAIHRSENNVQRHNEMAPEGIVRQRLSLLRCWCCRGCAPNKVGPVVVSKITLDTSSHDRQSVVLDQSVRVNAACFSANTDGTNAQMTEARGSNTVTSNTRGGLQQCQTSSQQQVPSGRRIVSSRTTKIAFLVCSIFVITWLPPWVSFFLGMSKDVNSIVKVIEFKLIGRMTYLINTATNPILYTWLNRTFRQRAKTILTCRRV